MYSDWVLHIPIGRLIFRLILVNKISLFYSLSFKLFLCSLTWCFHVRKDLFLRPIVNSRPIFTQIDSHTVRILIRPGNLEWCALVDLTCANIIKMALFILAKNVEIAPRRAAGLRNKQKRMSIGLMICFSVNLDFLISKNI